MSDILEFPSGEKREAKVLFTPFASLAEYAKTFGDHSKSAHRNADVDKAIAAQLEQQAEALGTLASKCASVQLQRHAMEISTFVKRLETMAAQIEAMHHVQE